jgi:hypothetical protein
MRETVLRLNSSYLGNERSIWICEPESVSGASDLVVFLDGERYRGRVDALSVIEELRGRTTIHSARNCNSRKFGLGERLERFRISTPTT